MSTLSLKKNKLRALMIRAKITNSDLIASARTVEHVQCSPTTLHRILSNEYRGGFLKEIFQVWAKDLFECKLEDFANSTNEVSKKPK